METKQFFYIDIQPTVHESLVEMYDRYIEASLTARAKPQPLMNYSDFVNQIIVRGMIAYAKPLEALEKELNESS